MRQNKKKKTDVCLLKNIYYILTHKRLKIIYYCEYIQLDSTA